MVVVSLDSGFHLVSPGSSFISSTSATSISGLRRGEEVTELVFAGGELTSVEDPWREAELASPTKPPRIVGLCLGGVIWRLGEVSRVGPRTLMVTLLGVIGKGVGSPSSISEDCDAFWPLVEVTGVLARPALEGVAPNGSADMLL